MTTDVRPPLRLALPRADASTRDVAVMATDAMLELASRFNAIDADVLETKAQVLVLSGHVYRLLTHISAQVVPLPPMRAQYDSSHSLAEHASMELKREVRKDIDADPKRSSISPDRVAEIAAGVIQTTLDRAKGAEKERAAEAILQREADAAKEKAKDARSFKLALKIGTAMFVITTALTALIAHEYGRAAGEKAGTVAPSTH